MDVKEYISSGILETYVLGGASDKEIKEVECMSHIYPEVKEEITKLQQSIEVLAQAQSVEPPKELRSKILAAIDSVEQVKQNNESTPSLKAVHVTKEPSSGKTVSMYWKIAAAASVALIIGISGMWVNSNSKIGVFEQQLAAFDEDNDELETKNKELLAQLSEVKETMEKKEYINYILAHSATQKVNMPGTDNSPESEVRVYWNTATKGVFLKVDELPTPEEEKQYQLWAIVDGKPTDMGIFDIEPSKVSVQQMPYEVENAQAFAITLEKKGGSKEPTLSAMYVVGTV